MPYGLINGAMAKSPDGGEVILFGGYREFDGREDRILGLSAEADSWNILNSTLQNGRSSHVVIPLP